MRIIQNKTTSRDKNVYDKKARPKIFFLNSMLRGIVGKNLPNWNLIGSANRLGNHFFRIHYTKICDKIFDF